MPRFGELIFSEGLFGPGGELDRVPWIFQELGSVDSYVFPVNPLDAKMPTISKTITTMTTASGLPINFEGKRRPQKLSFSGTLLTQEQYQALDKWSKKTTQIQITDDLEQSYWVIIDSFDPKRAYHASYPWRHEYNVEATVISWE